jgi:hypothetical protein
MATRLAPPPADALYDEDFALWAEQQAAHLRAGRFDRVDIENVSEEIEALSRSDKRSITSRLATVMEHLLKLALSDDRDPRPGWWHTVNRERSAIESLLEESPSLRRQMPAFARRAWRDAVRDAAFGLRAAEAQRIPREPALDDRLAMTVDTDEALAALFAR